MAWLGIESNLAVAGSWAMTMPPASLMSWMPAVPLLPAPVKTMAMALVFRSSASAVKKRSIGWRWPRGSLGSLSRRMPPSITRVCAGTMT